MNTTPKNITPEQHALLSEQADDVMNRLFHASDGIELVMDMVAIARLDGWTPDAETAATLDRLWCLAVDTLDVATNFAARVDPEL